MITRSKSKIMPTSPATSTGMQVNIIQPSTSQHVDSIAPSETSKSKSSRSSSTIKAQKAAVEALALRRRLEHEQELAERERQRESRLAALRQQVEEGELKAELAALDAEAAASHSSRSGSARVSVERTERWVQSLGQPVCVGENTVNRGIPAVGREQVVVPPPGHQAPLPATGSTASPVNRFVHQKQLLNVTKASEAAVLTRPLISTEVDQSSLLQAVADTAAAAKALATSHRHKHKIELFPFDGDALTWLHFKRIFDLTKNNFSNIENISRLQNALRGAARDAVASLLLATDNPNDIIRALEENFARPEIIVFKEVSALKNLPRLGNDLKELITITNKVRNSISSFKILNQIEYLHSPELFHAVLGKLNPVTKVRWTDFAMQDTTGRPKLEIMSDFLRRELDQLIRFGLLPESCSIQHSSQNSQLNKP